MKKGNKIRYIYLERAGEYSGIDEPTQTAEITEEEKKKGYQFFRIDKNRKAILLEEVSINTGMAEQIVGVHEKCGIHLMVSKNKIGLVFSIYDKKRKEENEEKLIEYADQFFKKVKPD